MADLLDFVVHQNAVRQLKGEVSQALLAAEENKMKIPIDIFAKSSVIVLLNDDGFWDAKETKSSSRNKI